MSQNRPFSPAEKVLVAGVLRILEEMFPQVKKSVLWSAAFEHRNDADVAAEYIINEIIPKLKEQPQLLAPGYSSNSNSSLSPSEDRGRASKPESSKDSADSILGLPKLLSEAGPSSINASLPIATQGVNGGFSGQPNSPTVVEPVVLKALDKSLYHDANEETDVGGDGEPIVLVRKRRSYDNIDQHHVEIGGKNVVSDAEVSRSFHEEVTHHLDVSAIEAENNYIHLNVDTLKFVDPVNKELDVNSSSKFASEKDALGIENVSSENESTLSSMLNKLDEKCSIELLEESIEYARDRKKTLMLAKNTVFDLRREVEQKEKAVEQLKEQTTRDCLNNLSKVDEFKQTLRRAKETNDMHAGEVYAERAILATEYNELQLRLFTLTDEINKSLEDSDKERKALEIRLATALEQFASAEEDKVKQEMAEREARLHHESESQKVAEESKKLMLVAEKNSKLQELLMDCGRATDILQGEYTALLLKEKSEERNPLSRSLSSSQTSSILASTNSSIRSTTTATPLQPEFESPKKGIELDDSYGFLDNSSRSEAAESPKSSINTDAYFLCGEEKLDKSSRAEVDESPRSPINTGAYFLSGEEKEKRIADRKKLLEDGWELFENGDMLAS